MAILFGMYIHHDYTSWHMRGKDAFLAHQAHRFDTYMSTPAPVPLTTFHALVGAVIAFGLYELIAAALGKMLPSPESPTLPHGEQTTRSAG
jgi:hypothetical protein